VHDAGVRPGDRVAISMRNYPEWILAFTAITSIGAIAVAMNAHWQADEMAYALKDCGAKVLFADRERLERLSRCEPMPGLAVLAVRAAGQPGAPGSGARDLAALLAPLGDVSMPAADIAPDDAATILYTSGSTGHPKGVVSTHRNIVSSLLSWEADREIAVRVAGAAPPEPPWQQGTLLAVPLFHVTGLAASYLASYRLQRRVVCMYRWDAEQAAALVERERLTSLVGPAAVTGDLLRVAREGRHDLDCLLTLGGGGAPRAPEQVRQIGASFTNALPATGWGMTETFAIGAGIGGDDYLKRPASSGRCPLVLDLKVVDERGATLAPGQRGELMVRGASLFRGYWNRPEVDAEVFDGDWFRTGDMAFIDDEGFVFIVDRIKDLIIRGGENVGCGLVEAALLAHPGVHEAAVYAVPDERLGEEVGATIRCDDDLDPDALRAFLAERLAAFEVPRHIVRTAAPLPRTPSGKIFKRRIRDEALGRPPSGGAA
jgi:long-chain acyl-CoA synthetase